MNFYVIDHHPLVAEALARMLRNLYPPGHVVTLGRLDRLQGQTYLQGPPDVLLLNALLPDLLGNQGITELRSAYPQAVTVVLSTAPHATLEETCLNAGATLFVRHDTKVNALHQRLAKTLIAHFPFRSHQIRPKPRLLTIRQMQLLFAIENGATNLEMASMLGLSPHTIKVHLWRMFQRFGVNSRLQLLRYAYDHGMV